MFTPTLCSSSTVNRALLPNSVMLARIGTSTASRMALNSSRLAMASGKMASAPASTSALARSWAASRPSTARMSVRAMMRKFGSRRASAAARMRLVAVSRSTTFLPSRWPQRLGLNWSSMWQPASPAFSSSWTLRATFMGSPKPVSASTMAGRSVMRAICPARVATSVSVVSPMSGRPRSLASTAPEMYTPAKPFSSISRAESGLNAPGNCAMVPEPRIFRSLMRFCSGVVLEYSTLEQPLRCRAEVDDAGGGGDVQLVKFTGRQFREAFDGGEEPCDFVLLHEAGGQGAELVDVLLPGERPGAQRVRVRDRDLVPDHGPVGQGDLHRAAEGLLGDVEGVVAAGPFRILHGGDFLPQLHGVGAGGAFGGVGVHVVPGPVLQCDRED